jgi:hypothetical protein
MFRAELQIPLSEVKSYNLRIIKLYPVIPDKNGINKPIELKIILKFLAVIQVSVVFQGAQGVGGAKAGYEHAEGVVVDWLGGNHLFGHGKERFRYVIIGRKIESEKWKMYKSPGGAKRSREVVREYHLHS